MPFFAPKGRPGGRVVPIDLAPWLPSRAFQRSGWYNRAAAGLTSDHKVAGLGYQEAGKLERMVPTMATNVRKRSQEVGQVI
jgi:hypothetical protein